jgi:flavin reductase (DIM6/NTAB) family NADH-FMN oxidoreductase RutF
MKKQIGVYEAFSETMEHIGGNGLLLVADAGGNPMTIGWGTIGRIWNIPIFAVLVRPSRYTFTLIEGSDEFSVNLLSEDYAKQIAFCGTESGRDYNKVEKCGFSLEQGKQISIPHLQQASVVYECRIVHKNDIINAALDSSIVQEFYPQGDFHSVYFGRILGVYREERG